MTESFAARNSPAGLRHPTRSAPKDRCYGRSHQLSMLLVLIPGYLVFHGSQGRGRAGSSGPCRQPARPMYQLSSPTEASRSHSFSAICACPWLAASMAQIVPSSGMKSWRHADRDKLPTSLQAGQARKNLSVVRPATGSTGTAQQCALSMLHRKSGASSMNVCSRHHRKKGGARPARSQEAAIHPVAPRSRFCQP